MPERGPHWPSVTAPASVTGPSRNTELSPVHRSAQPRRGGPPCRRPTSTAKGFHVSFTRRSLPLSLASLACVAALAVTASPASAASPATSPAQSPAWPGDEQGLFGESDPT